MKRLLYIVMLIALVALSLSACAPAADKPAATAAPAEEQPAASSGEPLYVFLPKGLDNPYWDNCRKGMEAKAAELGVNAEFIGPEKSDATLQVGVIESVIARNPAAIAISPNDPATVNELIARQLPKASRSSPGTQMLRIAIAFFTSVQITTTPAQLLPKSYPRS
jgi:ABC-type sugar transport system substrate-binding protein